MADQPADVESIVLQAAKIESAESRAIYLDDACGTDTPRRRKVEWLLRQHAQNRRFAEASAPGATIGPAIAESPGSMIGPYKLLEKIGEGGMGLVYMARQRTPVKRNVALKLIKPGMDSKHVIARFEAERQALALMDHPNIARVLDAGSTESGRPYFVMDLVRGIPITEYCDRQRLSTSLRLKLFVSVCQAVQHAHQKGIIHRDIKPTNVLITLHDGTPVPKVIDFGIAKATNRQLTEETLVTGFAQAVGTPSYMSPEQAALGGLDIDTRADVYSLGVLLYELLTGSTPFQDRLTDISDDEFRRIIREEEPPKPSTRLSTLGESLDTVAEKRQTDRQTLSQQVRGEMDWIVMKALEKDRTRRYETANDLALDIERYLSDDPVEACPPSRVYRLRKAVRRNKAAVLTTLTAGLVLIVGTAIAMTQAVRATNAEQVAADQVGVARDQEQLAKEQERLAQEQKRLAQEAAQRETALRQLAEEHAQKAQDERRRTESNLRLALEALDGVYLTISKERLPQKLHLDRTDQELLTKALTFYERFARQNHDDARLRLDTAKAYRRVGEIQTKLGQYETAETAFSQAIALLEELRVAAPGNTQFRSELAGSLAGLGAVLRTAGRYSRAEQVLSRSVTIRRSLVGAPGEGQDRQRELAHVLGDSSELYRRIEQYSDAERLAREAVSIFRGLVAAGPDAQQYRYGLADAQMTLGILLGETGKLERAESTCHAAMNVLEELAAESPGVVRYRAALARACNNLGVAMSRGGRNEDAVPYFRKYVALFGALAEQHPRVPRYREGLGLGYGNLASALRNLDDSAQAETSGRLAVDVLDELAREDPEVVSYQERLAAACKTLGDILKKDPSRIRQATAFYERQLAINAKLAEKSTPPALGNSTASESLDQAVAWLHAHDVDDESVAQDYRRNLAVPETVAGRFLNLQKYSVQHVDTYRHLGETAKAAGRLKEAEQYFQHALRIYRGLSHDARVLAARTMRTCETAVVLPLPDEPLFFDRPFFDGDHLVSLLHLSDMSDAEHNLHRELTLNDFQSSPKIVHPEWELTRVVLFPKAVSAHYNPRDERLYVGRNESEQGNGLYQIDASGTAVKLAGNSPVVGVAIDHRNGNVFFSEDITGNVRRITFGGTQAEKWVSEFVNGNTHPVGLAVVGDNYLGTEFSAGQGLVTNHGHVKNAEVFRFSADQPQGEVLLRSDVFRKGLLDVPLDVTLNSRGAFIVDRTKGIFRLGKGGTCGHITTVEPLHPTGIVADPISDDLFVVDSRGQRLVLVDPDSGSVTTIAEGLVCQYWGGAGIDVTPDGTRLFYTEHDTGAILTLSRTSGIESRFARGRKLLDSKQFKQAVDLFTEEIDRNPEHALAHCERGFAHAGQGQLEKAKHDWATALRIDPLCAQHYFYRGEVLREEKRLEDALEQYGKALQLNPELACAYRGRAQVHTALGEFNEVIREATEAIRFDPQDGRAYADRGFAFHALRERDKAEDNWHEAHRIDNSLAEEYFRVGETYAAIALPNPDNFPQAIAAYTKAIQLDPTYAMAYQQRGRIQWLAGSFEPAAADYASAFKHFAEYHPNRFWAAYFGADANFQIGKFDEALDDSERLFELSSQDPFCYLKRAQAYVGQGKIESAVSAWRWGKGAANAVDVSDVRCLIDETIVDRGTQLVQQKQFDAAIAEFTKSVEFDREYAPAYCGRGIAHFQLGHLDQAIADCLEAIALQPNAFWLRPDCLPNYLPIVVHPNEEFSGVQFASDLPWLRANAGYAFKVPYRDRRFHGGPIHIAGREYMKGLYTHSFHDGRPADIVFDISGRKFAEFKSDVGHPFYWEREGSVQFQVLVDGELKAQSPVLHMRDLHTFQVDVSNARQVTLRVNDGGDGFAGDHAAWGAARFIQAGARDPLEPSISAGVGEPPKAWLLAALLHGALRDDLEARRCYAAAAARIEEHHPRDEELGHLLAEVEKRLGAAQPTADPRAALHFFHRGRNHVQAGELLAAIDEFGQAIRLDPQLAKAYAERGFAFSEMGETDKAQADWKAAHRIDGRLTQKYFQAGESRAAVLHRKRENYPLAVLEFTRAIQLDSSYALAYRRRADVHKLSGIQKPALADYSSALNHLSKDDPIYISTLTRRARANIGMGRLEQALVDGDALLRFSPDDPSGHMIRAQAYVRMGKIDLAIAAWQLSKHIATNPDQKIVRDRIGEVLVSRGVLLLQQGKIEAAVAAFTTAVDFDAQCASAYCSRALAHFELGHLDQAVADFRQAIKLQPNNELLPPDCFPNYLSVEKRQDDDLSGIRFAADMPWIKASSGFASNSPARHRWGDLPHIAGKTHEKGFVTTPCHGNRPADIVFNIAGGDFAQFKSDVGLPFCWAMPGSVQFQVLVDGTVKAESPVLRLRQLCTLRADVAGATEVTLRVLNGGDNNAWDHAAWGNPRFIKAHAQDPLEPSLSLRKIDEPAAWLLAALLHDALGDKVKARRWIEKTAAWIEQHDPADQNLVRLLTEVKQRVSMGRDTDGSTGKNSRRTDIVK